MQRGKTFKFIVLVLVVGLLITGCSSHENSSKEQYEIETIVIEGYGEIKKEPSGPYSPGTKVTLTAKPEDGCKFNNWDGSLKGEEPKQTVIVEDKMVVRAKFVDVPTIYNLGINTNKDGTATLTFEVKEDEREAKKVEKVTINWGDGESSKPIEVNSKSKKISKSHTYEKEKRYTIEIIAQNNYGKERTRTKEVAIGNVAPKFDVTMTKEKQKIILEGTITDEDNSISNALIKWYQGAEPQHITRDFKVSNDYSSMGAGSYLITLTATDDEGGTGSKNITAKIPIIFKDENFEEEIRDAINKPSKDIYVEDIKKIERLDCYKSKIFSIESIKYFKELITLQLSKNQISNTEFLSNLTNLKELYLEDNEISDISALKNLTELEELDLARNWKISDITALKKLTNLKKLNLKGNQINDISILENLINLKELNLSWNDELGSISVLKNLINLQELYIRGSKISNIDSLSSLTNLFKLNLNYNKINDITVLKNLTSLKKLSLQGNQISNIGALSNLNNLEEVNFGGNEINNVSSLSNLTNLKDLDLHWNQISDISALSNLTNLEELDLDNNQISDINALSDLTNLKDLDLYSNEISDISALSNLTNLEGLRLNDNQISDVNALSNLTNLKSLYLNSNQISDISVLSNLTNLNDLWIRDNNLDLSTGSADMEVINKLEKNGVEVHY